MYEIYCKLRNEKGVKDSDVVKATGITKSTFSDWKSGRSKPKNDKLQKIADYFGVTLDYLTTGNDDMIKEKPPMLTARDERDIKKDLDSLREKLLNKDLGSAAYDGEDIPDDDIELFLGQVNLMLHRLKVKNKAKYGNKNKK